MNQMISYIFETLQKNETTLKQVTKSIKKQSRANAWLVLAGVGYVWMAEYRRKEQEKKIRELRKDLNELMYKKAAEEVEVE